MIFPRRIITIFMSIACVFIAGCLPKTPVSAPEKADWLYLKATDLQNDEATAEFKQFQLQIGNSDPNQGNYEAAIEAYQLVSHDGDAIDEATLAIGDAYMMLGHQSEALSFYRSLTDKYPYFHNAFARSAQERIDALTQLDALHTAPSLQSELALNLSTSSGQAVVKGQALNTRPHAQRDNAQYQIATVYFNLRDDDTAVREEEIRRYAQDKFEKVDIDYPESELSDEAMWMRGEC